VEKYFPELSAEFARLLQRVAGRKIAVVGHARPDGDCIGAQVALARVLTARGHDVICVNADPVPRRLQFLVAGMRFFRTDEILASTEDRAAILVDCADHARPGERLKARYPAPVAVIDHHMSNLRDPRRRLSGQRPADRCAKCPGIVRGDSHRHGPVPV
jgi:phosphoesterase RecJ-like protein